MAIAGCRYISDVVIITDLTQFWPVSCSGTNVWITVKS